jgi:hypothetical protein
MTTAGAGLLQNTGLAPNAALTSSLSNFTSVPAVGDFTNLLPAASSVLGAGTFSSLASLGATSIPGLTNVIPSDLTGSLASLVPGGVTNLGVSGLINSVSNGIMGDGDLSRFTQIFNTAAGYASQATDFISSAVNVEGLSTTFSDITGGMNNLITGGFNQVSSSLAQFGQDLGNLGTLVDLGNLPSLGDPARLLQQVTAVAGSSLPSLEQALGAVGINSSSLNSLTAGVGSFTASAQKDLYAAFTQVTGSELDQVKSVLGVTTSGITNMAQLLDPKAILPNSFQNLKMPTPDGLQNVYTAVGSINTNIERYLQDPNAPEYTGDDPIVRARLGLPPISTGTLTA